MPTNSLGETSSSDRDPRHGVARRRADCGTGSDQAAHRQTTTEEALDQAVESAVMRSVFGHSEIRRRSFTGLVGGAAVTAALSTVFPLKKAKAAILDDLGPPEKTDVAIGYVPIICATPIIIAQTMGFYERYGLNAETVKTVGWAEARDKALSGEHDASLMPAALPLAMTLGAGSIATPYTMSAVASTNGQAIVLSNTHLDRRDPTQWTGFTFGVPFEHSMHNFLLRYYAAEFGLDPDHDIQIRVVPPTEMVANLRAGRLDGYLAPEPFNQRAVWERIGFIHILTKEIWDGHPSGVFAAPLSFAEELPNTYGALLGAFIDATQYASNPDNRAEIAETISPTRYLNQPVPVVQQVLTGTFADGAGEVQRVPDRIGFDPFPWQSMGVWILTQMKRWGFIESDVDWNGVAEQVYLATDAKKAMEDLGFQAPDVAYKTHSIMGKTFDPVDPERYLASFEIGRK